MKPILHETVRKLKAFSDTAKTPYQRVLEAGGIRDTIKEGLRQYSRLNPAELHRQIVRLQNKLIEMATLKEEVRPQSLYKAKRGPQKSSDFWGMLRISPNL